MELQQGSPIGEKKNLPNQLVVKKYSAKLHKHIYERAEKTYDATKDSHGRLKKESDVRAASVHKSSQKSEKS